MVAINGDVVAQGVQFSLNDVVRMDDKHIPCILMVGSSHSGVLGEVMVCHWSLLTHPKQRWAGFLFLFLFFFCIFSICEFVIFKTESNEMTLVGNVIFFLKCDLIQCNFFF